MAHCVNFVGILCRNYNLARALAHTSKYDVSFCMRSSPEDNRSMELLTSLLNNPRFMPHGHCYLWRPDILWTHILSDVTIALSYFAIPVVLILFLKQRRQELIYTDLLVLFSAFIFLCGMTHLSAIYVTWYPAYELQGWLKAATALVSLATAIALIPRLPMLITLPRVQRIYEETQKALDEAKLEKQEMESLFELTSGREERIYQLKLEVNRLLDAQGLPPKYLIGEGS